MSIRILAMALVIIAIAPRAAAAQAQSVTGLSAKTKQEAPAAQAADSLARVLELIAAINAATTEEERGKLMTALTRFRTASERRDGTDPINLAVPAGATASIGEGQKAAAGPVLGFQAWKTDDFFAGAFFTFDAAPTLNGDTRKAGEFLRNPPAAGTSFFISGSRMLSAWNDGHVRRPRKRRNTGVLEPLDTMLLGFSLRAGATSVTLEHHEGDDIDSREAFILHATPAILLTSRTFSDENDGEYQFGLEIGTTLRWIGGDAAQDKDFLAQPDVFGHASTRFIGFDATFFARLNAFQPFVRLTHIPKRQGRHVPGLTGGQALFGVSVQSALFQGVRENGR